MDYQPPHKKFSGLIGYRSKLESYYENLINKGMYAIGPVGVGCYMVEFMLLGLVKRSIDIIEGFILLIDTWNIAGAAPMVRMQLDNLLRLCYFSTLNDYNEVSQKIMSGIPLNKIKDKEGKNLTDQRLREYAKSIFPWIDDVYERTSKFIHFSDQHVFLPIYKVNDNNRVVNFCIGRGSPEISEEDITSYYTVMIDITDGILAFLNAWGKLKRDRTEEIPGINT